LSRAELDGSTAQLGAMDNWCNETRIAFTPTFFINSYQLPELYQVKDLKHFL